MTLDKVPTCHPDDHDLDLDVQPGVRGLGGVQLSGPALRRSVEVDATRALVQAGARHALHALDHLGREDERAVFR